MVAQVLIVVERSKIPRSSCPLSSTRSMLRWRSSFFKEGHWAKWRSEFAAGKAGRGYRQRKARKEARLKEAGSATATEEASRTEPPWQKSAPSCGGSRPRKQG